ncbi:MAG: nitrous oxide reductase family maturation protein NosD [Dehalococcoidia bacterium]|nr:nitrous oxide reductase family maturation protein NosD [Dehalococcoidia bacterium]
MATRQDTGAWERPERTAEEPREAGSAVSLAWSRIDRVWGVCAVLAALAVLAAAFRPLWRMELLAPQYPGGLHLYAYGTHMEGDLSEINTLNHYVGIRPIDPDTLLELKAFPFVIAGLVLLLLAGAVWARSTRVRLLLAAAVVSVPLGMLVDLQWWLYQYGHDLAPSAPIRLEPFTPKVLGTTTVVNFHTETMVDSGFWMLVGAALLLAAGPRVVRFVRESWSNTGAAAVAVLLVTGAALALPSATAAASPALAAADLNEAIAAAVEGSTLAVPAGTYVGTVVVDKPLTLVADGTVVLDGAGMGDVVQVTADGVTLRGFTVRNSARNVSDEPTGIRLSGNHATVEGNRVEDVLYGISLLSSGGHVVRDNYVSSMADLAPERRGHALYLWYSTDNLIEGNTITLAKDGIFAGFARNTRIHDNVVTHVRYGLHTMYAQDLHASGNVFRQNIAGASLMYSQRLTVVDNEFSGNRSLASGYGLLLKDMDDVLLQGNRIHGNRLGMTMEGAPRTPGTFVTVQGNLIASNQIAVELFTTTDVSFLGNSFIGNLQQVESRGGNLEHRNRWSVEGRGNYWDDYQGFDADGDGIGDLAYRYEGTYDELVQRSPAVRAYSFTPARSALDLAARWFPVYRVTPRVVDEHPLMSPTITLASGTPRTFEVIPALVSLALTAAALSVFVAAKRTMGRQWTPSC